MPVVRPQRKQKYSQDDSSSEEEQCSSGSEYEASSGHSPADRFEAESNLSSDTDNGDQGENFDDHLDVDEDGDSFQMPSFPDASKVEIQSEADIDTFEAEFIRDPTELGDLDTANLSHDNYDDDDEEALFEGNQFSLDYYRQGIESMDIEPYKHKSYSNGTIRLIKMIENQWILFCRKVMRQADWKAHLSRINFQIVYNFVHWHLAQKIGRGGRKKWRISKKASLTTFWCCFRLVYERHVASKIDHILDRNIMHNALVELGNKFQLTHEARENRSMTIKDLKILISTTLSTTEKTFELGELRILAVLFLLFLAPQGSRPSSILDLRFGDLELRLARDPANPSGKPVLVIRLSLQYTKQYLGKKATKHFMIPEIIYDPNLLLSPHVFLLALLFKYKAFESEGLNDNPHLLSQLKVHNSSDELTLSLKEELRDKLVFRRAEKDGLGGFKVSEAPIGYAMMSKWIKRMGEILGFEYTTICYTLRYMAGNHLDQSTTISDSLRNLIMDHAPQSDTFQKHYLNRNVSADTWAIHKKTTPQQELIDQAISHGHSRNSRRPIGLSPEESAAVLANSPRYQELTAQLRRLPTGPRSTEARRDLTAKRDRIRKKLQADGLREAKKKWSREQALDDIERQINGEDFAHTSAHHDRPVRPMGAGQQKMFNAIIAPLPDDAEAIAQRRTNAICAMIEYFPIEEPTINFFTDLKRKAAPNVVSPRKPATTSADKRKQPTLEESKANQDQILRESVMISTMGQDNVRRCFVCIAKALTLQPGDPNFDMLSQDFYNMTVLARHFDKIHLGMLEFSKDSVTKCPLCDITLKGKMHLRSHAHLVHGMRTAKRHETGS